MFIPENIDLGQSEKYILSIRIEPTRFMFSISEPNHGKSFCLRDTTFSAGTSLLSNIQRIVFDFNFLTQEFLETNVIIVSPEYDFVPSAYINSQPKTEFYNLVHTDKAERVLCNGNEKYSCTNQFKIDEDVYEFLSRSLFNPKYVHHTSLLLDLFGDKSKSVSLVSKMFLNFHGNLLDIVCYKHSKFMHCLTYADQPASNLAYFILKLWEKYEFDQFTDQLYIAGKPESELKFKLQEYIKNINPVDKPREVYLWNEDALKAPLDLLTISL